MARRKHLGDQVFTGVLNIETASGFPTFSIDSESPSGTNAYFRMKGSRAVFSNTIAQIDFQNFADSNNTVAQWLIAGDGDVNLSIGQLKVANNLVWHAGNDGAGSGLDADTLDGQHASAFATLNGAIFTGSVTATGFTGNGGGLTGVNADNLGGQSASSYALLSGAIFTGTVGAAQLQVNGADVWHPGNDGSGSGLDADTLDGDHGSAFAKLSGAVFTGGITATGFTGNGGGLTGVDADNLGGQAASSYALLSGANFTGNLSTPELTAGSLKVTGTAGLQWENGINRITHNDGGGNVQIRFGNEFSTSEVFTHGGTAFYIGGDLDSTTAGTLTLKVASNPGEGIGQGVTWGPALTIGALTGLRYDNNSIWHAGNDGAGSGLDADTLDGQHASAFAALNGAIFTGSVTATGFTGNGGGLTGVNADNLGGQSASSYALLSGATFTGSVSASDFTGNGSNLTNVTAANSVNLGGLSSESYALLSGANFSGNVGIGGASADSFNRLSVNSSAALFNGQPSFEATYNKTAATDDAGFALKTGFSTRALVGTFGSDDFTIKTSPNGTNFFDAIVVDKDTGEVSMPNTPTPSAIAAGSTLGLEQALLANAGQPALTVLAVGFVTSPSKVQGCSLGDGNVVEVYASGADFNNGNVLYREFMSLGEPICFTGLSNGAIITSTQGFYGFCEGVDAASESPMPLLSYGLSFKSSFLFAFRNSNEFGVAGNDRGFVYLVNGPLKSVVDFTFGDASVVQNQSGIVLEPWQHYALETDGNVEYIINSTNPVMACVVAGQSDVDGVTGTNLFRDARLVMPLTNDGITWPRSGQVSAPYAGTQVAFFTRDNVEGLLNSTAGTGVSPGSPVDFDAAVGVGTGASDADYEPNGATRVLATGLISAFSGADGQGGEATPLMPTSAMSQVVAQPFHIADEGDGSASGIALASPFQGTAKVYSWNTTTNSLDLEYTIPLTRNNVTITSKEDQKHPAAGGVANDTNYPVQLVGDLAPGVIIADVPITAVLQNSSATLTPTIRSQNGTTTTSIVSQQDETLSLGWTPSQLKAEITEGADGILYKRVISGGTETWEIA